MFVQDPYFRRDLSAAKFTPNTHEIMPHETLSFRKIFMPVSTKDATGWRRLIGSRKLQIIFHKRATKYRSLLRKMTYKDKGSCESSPPCTRLTSTKSRNSDFSVSRSTNSNRNFGSMWICSEESQICKLVDFRGVAFLLEFVIFSKFPYFPIFGQGSFSSWIYTSTRGRTPPSPLCFRKTPIFWTPLFSEGSFSS